MSNLIIPRKVFKTIQYISTIGDLLANHTVSAGNKIDAKNVMYIIDSNSFDFGVYSLSNIVSGVRFGVQGAAKGMSNILSTANNISLIECINQNLLLSDIDISATGSGSQGINMIGTGIEAIDLLNVSFSGSTAMGTLDNLRQGFWTVGFSFGALRGFLLKGTWGGFRVASSRFINLQGYLLKGDVGFTIDNIRSDVNIDVLAGNVAFDFDFNMFNEDQGYQLEGGRYTGGGDMVAPFTLANGADTIETEKSKKSFFQGNKGNLAKNTRIGGALEFTTEASNSFPNGVLTELLGTTTANNLVHMLSDNPRELEHNTTSMECYYPFIDITIDGEPNREIKLSLMKVETGGGLVELVSKTKTISNVQGNRDVVDFSFSAPCFMLEEGEKVKLYATSIGANSNLTIISSSTLYLRV